MGHATPTPTPTPQGPAPQRVLVRLTQPEALPGIQVFDEHGDQRLGWAYRDRFEELAAQGAPVELHDPKLESQIKAQKRRLKYRTFALAHHWLDQPKLWLSDYRQQDEIDQALRHAAKQRGDLHLETLGQSVEGREILGLTLRGRGSLAKKRILILGTQHAREWLSTMACMSLLADWIHQSPTDTRARPTLTVVPVVNPDGYVYSWQQDRLWRKNRRPAPSKDGKNSEGGVDLNRNWGQSWGDPHGASDHPEDDAYHGHEAFSEPETRAVRDFVQSKGDVAAMLDVHTFGQWVIYPSSCQKPLSWGNHEFSLLAGQIASRITQSAGAQYSAIGGMDFSYPACGDAADWFAESQKSYALTLELRPGPSAGKTGFIQPPSAIAPTSKDLIAAVQDLRAWVSGEPFSGPVLATQGPPPVLAPEQATGQASEQAPAPTSLCAVGPGFQSSGFSIGALCCLGALGRKRNPSRRVAGCWGNTQE